MIINEQIKDAIKTGYGLEQLMKKYSLTQSALLALMAEDFDLKTKMQKRFRHTDWLKKEIGVPEEPEVITEPETDTPELALLKQEAKELGIEFSPRIGVDTLKKRIESAKVA